MAVAARSFMTARGVREVHEARDGRQSTEKLAVPKGSVEREVREERPPWRGRRRGVFVRGPLVGGRYRYCARGLVFEDVDDY